MAWCKYQFLGKELLRDNFVENVTVLEKNRVDRVEESRFNFKTSFSPLCTIDSHFQKFSQTERLKNHFQSFGPCDVSTGKMLSSSS